MSSSFHFLKAALKEPLQISTLFQTSALTVRKLISPLRADLHCSVLELGVGAGAVTSSINSYISDKRRYLGIEINEDLFKYVSQKYPNFKFICGSAEAISDLAVNQKFDLIVSTLPWSLFDQQMQQNILNQVKNHLERGGYFKTYMVCNALLTSSGKRFQSMLSEKFEVETTWEFINIPPAKVFECRLKR